MLGAEHGPAAELTAPARLVHAAPSRQRLAPRPDRVLEGGAAGLLAHGLALLPALGDGGHARPHRVGRVGPPLEQGAREDQRAGGRGLRPAVGVAHLGVGERHRLARSRQGVGLDQHVLGLGAVAARVHDQRAAHRTRHARVELQPRHSGLRRRLGERGVERRRARAQAMTVQHLDFREGAAQAHHHPLHPAVAHQRVGAHAQHGQRDRRVKAAEEALKVGLVGGQVEHVRRPAHAQPGVGRERRVHHDAPAHLRQGAAPAGGWCAHASASSWPGSAYAQAVMSPAPRHTTRSPGRVSSRTRRGRAGTLSSGSTRRWP